MPSKTFVTTLAANGVNENIFEGQRFEFSGDGMTHVQVNMQFASDEGTDGTSKGDVVGELAFTNLTVVDKSAIRKEQSGVPLSDQRFGGGVMRPSQRLVGPVENRSSTDAVTIETEVVWTEL